MSGLGLNFDNIRIGDIDLLSGGMFNQGLSGKDLARIFGSQAQAEVIQAEQARRERERNVKLFTISASVVITLIVLFFIYSKTKPKPST